MCVFCVLSFVPPSPYKPNYPRVSHQSSPPISLETEPASPFASSWLGFMMKCVLFWCVVCVGSDAFMWGLDLFFCLDYQIYLFIFAPLFLNIPESNTNSLERPCYIYSNKVFSPLYAASPDTLNLACDKCVCVCGIHTPLQFKVALFRVCGIPFSLAVGRTMWWIQQMKTHPSHVWGSSSIRELTLQNTLRLRLNWILQSHFSSLQLLI